MGTKRYDITMAWLKLQRAQNTHLLMTYKRLDEDDDFEFLGDIEKKLTQGKVLTSKEERRLNELYDSF